MANSTLCGKILNLVNILVFVGSFLVFGECYHSANVFTFDLVQSDHLKRLFLLLSQNSHKVNN